MSINKKEFARKHAWFMLTLTPVIIACIVYAVMITITGNVINAHTISLGAASITGIIAYAGIAIWEIVNS